MFGAIWAPTYDTLVNEETPLKETQNTHYTRSKYLSWLKTLEYVEQGLPIVTVMPAGVFGKGSPLFAPLLKLLNAIPVAIITKSTTKMSLIHVDDLIAGIIKAYEYGTSGRIYILSGEAVTLQQILRCCGARIVLDIPEPILRVIIRTSDYLSQIFRSRFYINTEFLNFTIGGLLLDGSRAKEELDFYVNDTRIKLSNMVKWHKEPL